MGADGYKIDRGTAKSVLPVVEKMYLSPDVYGFEVGDGLDEFAGDWKQWNGSCRERFSNTLYMSSFPTA